MKLQTKTYSILFFILLSITTYAQNSFINFYNINSLSGSISFDRKDFLELSNGDFVFAVYDEEVCSIVKTDFAGNFIWGKKLSGNWVLEPAQVIELNNNEILIVGRIRNLSDLSSEDIALVNFSSTGELNWSKRINEPDLKSVVTNIFPTSDGNLLITGVYDLSSSGGYYFADGYLAKISPTGELIQSKVISSGDYVTFSHVQELENNNIILFGELVSSQSSSRDLILILLDSNFNQIWSKSIYFNDSVSPFENYANTAIDFEVTNNSFLISTNVLDPDGYYSVILNLDMDANINYSKRFSIGNETLYLANFIVNQNNEAVFFGGYPNTRLAKINIADGSLVWSKELVNNDFGFALEQFTENNEYLFRSGSQNTTIIGKIDSDLSDCFEFQTIEYSDTTSNAFIEDIDLTITDKSGGFENFSPFEIETLNLTPIVFCEKTVNVSNPMSEYLVKVYPNPTERELHLSGLPENSLIYVIDFSGKIIGKWKNYKELNFDIDLFNFPRGIYLISIEKNGVLIFSEKFIKINK